MAVLLVSATQTQAMPITYTGTPLLDGVSQSGAVSSAGTYKDPATAQFWNFFGLQGNVVTIEALRLENDFDPAMWVFEGHFTDTSQFSGSFDDQDPGFLKFADDEIDNPGPWGDPRAEVTLTLPGTGQYTAAVTNYLSGSDDGGDGFFSYQITATTIPEPTSIVLWSLGCACLVGYGWRKRKQEG